VVHSEEALLLGVVSVPCYEDTSFVPSVIHGDHKVTSKRMV
jgi:hypothetical protein